MGMRRNHGQAGRAALCLIVCLLGGGCGGIRESLGLARGASDPQYVLSLHRFARADLLRGGLVRELTTDSGSAVAVRSIPLLSSKNFTSAELTTAAGRDPVLKMKLDRHGQVLWLQTCAGHAGDRVAVAVDGIYRFAMQIPLRHTDAGTVSLAGPWDATEAEEIAAWARENYRILNNVR